MKGFENRFTILRNDGSPPPDGARYIVLDYTGRDPSAVPALEKYADEDQARGNDLFAEHVRAALKQPDLFPAQTGADLALFVVKHNDRTFVKAAKSFDEAVALCGVDFDDPEVSVVVLGPLNTLFTQESR